MESKGINGRICKGGSIRESQREGERGEERVSGRERARKKG